ncbi:MAG: hypothetical protein ACLRWQ_14150 [Flavonifractor plautii]
MLNILKAYQHNAGHAMKRELEITIADASSAQRGKRPDALGESRIEAPCSPDGGARADLHRQPRRQRHYVLSNALHDLQKQLELQKLKLECHEAAGENEEVFLHASGLFPG